MPYGPAVPIVYASAAVKRILALAYLLVWTWTEHQRMSELRGLALASQVIFLVDELEAHLHPRWQRTIVRALLDVVAAMHAGTAVQIIAATHSPLVLASLEPYFDHETDRLLHLELRGGKVVLEELPWAKEGDVSAWLVSARSA
jgi:AAA domain, putative AbiEii toxin, Type IV TA system